jgi:hypothetical protein
MPLDVVIGLRVPGLPWWAPLMSSAVGLAILLWLIVVRNRVSVRACSIAFVINAAVIITAFWITSGAYVDSREPWIPFQANKLGSLAVALLAPELWAGIVSILGYIGTGLLRLWLFEPDVRARVATGEPWVLVAYGLMAAALLGYRLRSVAMERRIALAQAEAQAKEELARSMLALRDLANTPLQTIGLVSQLIRLRAPAQAGLLDRIDRALERLRGLNLVLARAPALRPEKIRTAAEENAR